MYHDFELLSGKLVFLKQFIKTNHAYLFKTSEKVLQATFEDTAELRFDVCREVLTFIDTKGVKSYLPLSGAMESDNKELKKHLTYVQELFKRLMKK